MEKTYTPYSNGGAGAAYSTNKASESYHQMIVGLGALTLKFNERRLRLQKKLGLESIE